MKRKKYSEDPTIYKVGKGYTIEVFPGGSKILRDPFGHAVVGTDKIMTVKAFAEYARAYIAKQEA